MTWLLLGAALVRTAAVVAGASNLSADTDGYRAMAEDLLALGRLEIGGNPTAFRPPLYPIVLATWGALFGFTPGSIGALQVVMGVATVGLVVVVSRQWRLDRAAYLAGILVACDPILVYQSTQVMTETLAALVATVGLVALSAVSRVSTTRRAILAGLGLALATLCRPTFLLWGLASAIALVFLGGKRPAPSEQTHLTSGWKLSAACVVGIAAGLLPWAARNQLQLGAPVFTTTHGGYTLWLANNADFYQFLRAGNWGDVWTSEKIERRWHQETARLTASNELARDRLAYQLARHDISEQPAMFVYSCLVRLGRFWALTPHRVVASESRGRQAIRYGIGLGYALEHLLMLAGFVALVRGRVWRAGWAWGVLLIVCLSAAHLVYWTDMRMRAPVVPAECLLAAVGAMPILARIARRKPK